MEATTTSACELAKEAKLQASKAKEQVATFIATAKAPKFDPTVDAKALLNVASKLKGQVFAANEANGVAKKIYTALSKELTVRALPRYQSLSPRDPSP